MGGGGLDPVTADLKFTLHLAWFYGANIINLGKCLLSRNVHTGILASTSLVIHEWVWFQYFRHLQAFTGYPSARLPFQIYFLFEIVFCRVVWRTTMQWDGLEETRPFPPPFESQLKKILENVRNFPRASFPSNENVRSSLLCRLLEGLFTFW